MNTQRQLLFLAVAAVSAATAPAQTATAVKVDNPRTVVVGERSVVDVYVSQFQDTLIVLPASELVSTGAPTSSCVGFSASATAAVAVFTQAASPTAVPSVLVPEDASPPSDPQPAIDTASAPPTRAATR